MTEKQILEKKQVGDLKMVAKILGVTQDNAYRILSRPRSKRYPRAIAILRKIIEDRERTLKEAEKIETDQ